MSSTVEHPVGQKILKENDRIALALRERFARHGVFVLNLISSPGSGKTTLLERTLAEWPAGNRVAVLTGDIQTDNDARRLARYGYPVRQITTAGACHLDARMVEHALEDWDLALIDTLLIENVGNLVCPTSYDLGEHAKIALLSVTEGDDKPLKYPGIFFKAALAVLTKIDLLPYVPFDAGAARTNVQSVNPGLEMIELSALTGQGMEGWHRWLAQRSASARSAFA